MVAAATRETPSTGVHSIHQVWWWWHYGVGVFQVLRWGINSVVPSSLDARSYCKIIDNEIIPILRHFYGMDPVTSKQQCHVRCGCCYYEDNNIQHLDWLAQISDLNPTERLGTSWTGGEISGDGPTSIAHLSEILQE